MNHGREKRTFESPPVNDGWEPCAFNSCGGNLERSTRVSHNSCTNELNHDQIRPMCLDPTHKLRASATSVLGCTVRRVSLSFRSQWLPHHTREWPPIFRQTRGTHMLDRHHLHLENDYWAQSSIYGCVFVFFIFSVTPVTLSPPWDKSVVSRYQPIPPLVRPHILVSYVHWIMTDTHSRAVPLLVKLRESLCYSQSHLLKRQI